MEATQIHTAIASAKVATAGGPPAKPLNPFFGVGPITDMVHGPENATELREAFAEWVNQSYRKYSDTGEDVGGFTPYELSRSMHRGHPADAILRDMAHHIHRYFGFPKYNRLAIGVGGGHAGFTVAAMHFINARDPSQGIFVDTARPETAPGGFFRQLWGTQIIEMMRVAPGGNADRLHFAEEEGVIPDADTLEAMEIRLLFGVGHETSGATTYTASDIENLIAWIDRDPARNHAIIDATSLLGAMPWEQHLIAELNRKANLFMPFQKAIGGTPAYFAITLTPAARAFIDITQVNPGFAIPRQYKLAVPEDPGRQLTARRTTDVGPLYDAEADAMVGGIINTFSPLAFAETTFGLLRTEAMVGDVTRLNAASIANRELINRWVAREPLFELVVEDPARRGCAVTLLMITDPDVIDPGTHAEILAKAKGLLGYEGLTFPDGTYEPGMDAARYIHAFPGTPGDIRAWIGGIRPQGDIEALLECMKYAWARAKIAVISRGL